jgi:Amt family ammonium transporter
MADPTIAELAKTLADNNAAMTTAVNMVWTLVGGFLVMFMMAGFAFVETGLTRAKNSAHTMAMNLFVYPLGILAFWAVGYAIMYGGVGPIATLGNDPTLNKEFIVTLAGKDFGLLGFKGWFLKGVDIYTPAVATMFLFQFVFMDAAATIPTGAMAERWKFTSFVLFSLVITALIYPLYGNWVWGGGWLANLGKNFGLGHGHVDFAGSSVVHMTGGVMAFVGAKMLGARIGKYGKDGSVRPIPAHNVPQVVLGTMILAFGWFGFNSASTLAGTDSRIAIVAVNTLLASGAGGVAAYLVLKSKFGSADITMICNGVLAGLVAITAPCAFVGAPFAVLIGLVAGVIVVFGALFVERVLRVDDPVGAVAVHGMNGAWGVLSLGLFANGTYGADLNGVAGNVRGLFYGDAGQLGAEAIGVLVNLVFVGAMAWLSLTVIGKIVGGNRVTAEAEIEGIDATEIGVHGYTTEPAVHTPGVPSATPLAGAGMMAELAHR